MCSCIGVLRLSLGGQPLIQSGGIKGVVHAVGEHVDNVDSGVRSSAGLVVSVDGAEGGTAGGAGACGGAGVGHVRGGASDAGDGVEACFPGGLGGHVDGEGGGVGLGDGGHDDGVGSVVVCCVQLFVDGSKQSLLSTNGDK